MVVLERALDIARARSVSISIAWVPDDDMAFTAFAPDRRPWPPSANEMRRRPSSSHKASDAHCVVGPATTGELLWQRFRLAFNHVWTAFEHVDSRHVH
jgi:hypothetical protein